MVDLFIESGHASINKHDETLCGDSYSIKKNGEQLVAVLSDGLGSGVKANILSTLTSKIISTMVAGEHTFNADREHAFHNDAEPPAH